MGGWFYNVIIARGNIHERHAFANFANDTKFLPLKIFPGESEEWIRDALCRGDVAKNSWTLLATDFDSVRHLASNETHARVETKRDPLHPSLLSFIAFMFPTLTFECLNFYEDPVTYGIWESTPDNDVTQDTMDKLFVNGAAPNDVAAGKRTGFRLDFVDNPDDRKIVLSIVDPKVERWAPAVDWWNESATKIYKPIVKPKVQPNVKPKVKPKAWPEAQPNLVSKTLSSPPDNAGGRIRTKIRGDQ